MYHVSAQGLDERMINVHYYYGVTVCRWVCSLDLIIYYQYYYKYQLFLKSSLTH